MKGFTYSAKKKRFAFADYGVDSLAGTQHANDIVRPWIVSKNTALFGARLERKANRCFPRGKAARRLWAIQEAAA